MYQKSYKSPIGTLYIVEENEKIIEIRYENEKEEVLEKNTKILEKAVQELEEYFKGKRKEFDIPLNPKGTEFMKKVWKELQKIPYGKTTSYGKIAEKIGNPKASRAVGMANHNNPIPIIIPCHRVIGKNNKMVGYALGIDKKRISFKFRIKSKRNGGKIDEKE